MKIFLILLAGVVLLLSRVVAADDFESGNQFYDQGKFGEAKHEYERCLESGGASANLFYNLGNTDYRLGSPGRAMLNYERALALDPRHPEAAANLRLLREQAGAKLPRITWVGKILASQPANVWAGCAAAAGWVMLFGLVWVVTARRAGTSGLWSLVVLSAVVLGVAFAGLRAGVREQVLAIITAKQTEARLAPAASAGVAEALTAGSRVRVLSERGEWIYCELPGEGRGWLPQGALERVRLERL